MMVDLNLDAELRNADWSKRTEDRTIVDPETGELRIARPGELPPTPSGLEQEPYADA